MFAREAAGAVSAGQDESGLAKVEAALPGHRGGCPPVFDGWELDEQLKHVERVLAAESAEASAESAEVVRMDPIHASGGWHRRQGDKRKRRRRENARSSGVPVLVWPLLSLGLMAFVCGGVLVGWSLVAGRSELWNIGLPIALAGQVGLLIALVLQIERIRENHRTAAAKLDRFDEELHDLKTYGVKNALK